MLISTLAVDNYVDEYQNNYDEWKKPYKSHSKGSLWLHLHKTLENENYSDRKQNSDCLGTRARQGEKKVIRGDLGNFAEW